MGKMTKRERELTAMIEKYQSLGGYDYLRELVETDKNKCNRATKNVFCYTTKTDEDLLRYSAGHVAAYAENSFIVVENQLGAAETFSIGQPVYDKNKNKLGYLGIGLFQNLNYCGRRHGENIPVEYWMICHPTKYCKSGVTIYTYWQTFGANAGWDGEGTAE